VIRRTTVFLLILLLFALDTGYGQSNTVIVSAYEPIALASHADGKEERRGSHNKPVLHSGKFEAVTASLETAGPGSLTPGFPADGRSSGAEVPSAGWSRPLSSLPSNTAPIKADDDRLAAFPCAMTNAAELAIPRKCPSPFVYQTPGDLHGASYPEAPPLLWLALVTITGAILLAVCAGLVLRKRANARTMELDRKNNELSAEAAQRRSVERQLLESEKRYRALVENTLEGLFVLGYTSGRFLFMNQRMTDLFGLTGEEAEAVNLSALFEAASYTDLLRDLHTLLDGGGSSPLNGVYDAARKDGSTFRAEIMISEIQFNGMRAAQGFVRDITGREKIQEKLRQAQKMEAVGALAGGLAHDFNNLLTAISCSASLIILNMGPHDPRLEYAKNIEQHVESGAKITRQLLNLARGGPYEVKSTDINQLIAKTTDMFGRAKKEILVKTNLADDLHTAEVDQGQIEQVLYNMYVNAWQAMPGGGVLTVETANAHLSREDTQPHWVEPGAYIKISVTDTGVGIDKSIQSKIFEPFFTTKEKEQGTGLGLASAYGIIKNHKGFITVYSELTKGSLFTIYLPASVRGAAVEETPSCEPARGTETILLVDDDEAVLSSGGRLLAKLGYRVETATDGEAALEKYLSANGSLDLVILDMVMPRMNGEEALSRMRAIDPTKKILISSGYSAEGQAKTSAEKGFDGFIQKPYTLEELSLKIGAALKR